MPSKFRNNYLPEFLAFITGRPKPSMVTVNLTSRCNQHCMYCEIGRGIPSDNSMVIAKEDMFWILDEMQLARIKRISLCGGEPFLFDGIMDVICYASVRGIRCSITTNGMTVFRLMADDFEILRRNHADINLSIDSFNEEIEKITRGVTGSVENVIKSIEKFQSEKIPVTLLAAISKYNFTGLFDLVKKADQLGIMQILFQPVIHHSNYPDRPVLEDKAGLNVPAEDLDVLMLELHDILRYEKNHRIRTNVYRILPWISSYIQAAAGQNGKWFFEDVLDTFYCREIYAAIDITYDGGLQPCGLTRATLSIKDRQKESLIALWDKATKKIKSDISPGNYYSCCNACCHKFSRNMMASMMKYPVRNRTAILTMVPLLGDRIISRAKKRIYNVIG
jgi:MoaA/NifB/PqqE/SkfB family radical SAM enzyme